MSVKGRKFRQARHKPTDRGHTLKAIFQAKHAVGRERLHVGMASRAERTRHALTDTFAQAQRATAAVDEEVCPGCGLEQHSWKGNKGKGYPRGGERYCCRPCADELECACQQ
jgi:hypothetical protein